MHDVCASKVYFLDMTAVQNKCILFYCILIIMLYNHVYLNVCTLLYVNITLGFTYAFSCVSEMQTQSDALYKSYILSLQRQQNTGALRREWNG